MDAGSVASTDVCFITGRGSARATSAHGTPTQRVSPKILRNTNTNRLSSAGGDLERRFGRRVERQRLQGRRGRLARHLHKASLSHSLSLSRTQTLSLSHYLPIALVGRVLDTIEPHTPKLQRESLPLTRITEPHTPNSKPQTLNTRPYTPNPDLMKPQTLTQKPFTKHEPQTPSPQAQTHVHQTWTRSTQSQTSTRNATC